jgi:ankyrin repeat protein
VPTISLPADPSLEQLRKQAKELRASEPHLTLSEAQRAVAQRYGFASWPRMKHHVELVNGLSRAPDEIPVGSDPVHALLREACVTYGNDDGPDHWARARALLRSDPSLGTRTLHAAAVTNDVNAVREHLARNPHSVDALGGPFAWTPLFCLAYSCIDPDVREKTVIDTAGALLDGGADPNAGYLWHGLPTPFTVLTGVFGEGEGGPTRQPRHPHSLALARLLLERGANPNDGQALYNRMFSSADDHLELLFEFGLGRGDGGPWKARLGAALDSPSEMLDSQMRWALDHEMPERIALLEAHGVARAEPGPLDAAISVLLRGDVPAADHLAAVRASRPGLIVWAAARGRGDAIPKLVELGFDVNQRARQDTPIEHEWETALHAAVARDDIDLVRTLLALGADPDIRDERFGATPLGWAEYFEHPTLIDLLRGHTSA